MKPFVFLDRDGTLIVQKAYLADPAEVALTAGAADALAALRDAGFGLAVVTNQSGVGRGMFDLDRVNAVHARMLGLLAARGVHIDAIRVCPHRPEEMCGCRKPNTDLVEAVIAAHDVDRAGSFLVGDKSCDIECARKAGLKAVLVRTGYGADEEQDIGERADFVADDLPAAAAWIAGEPRL